MEEYRAQPPVQESQKKTKKGFKTTLYILLALLFAGATGYGVYLWQQQEVDDLKNKNSQSVSENQNKVETKEDPEVTKFDDKAVPFTFEYPSTWSRIHDKPLTTEAPLSDQYAVTLVKPGSVIEESLFGTTHVSKGSRIIIYVSKTNIAKVSDRFTGIYQYATDKKDKIVNGIDAVQYNFAYESDNGIYTDLIKDGILYSIGFFSDKTKEAEHDSYPGYENLVSSFKFKE